jgi:hypothetical protein
MNRRCGGITNIQAPSTIETSNFKRTVQRIWSLVIGISLGLGAWGLEFSVTFGWFFFSNGWKAFRLLNGRCNHNMTINL